MRPEKKHELDRPESVSWWLMFLFSVPYMSRYAQQGTLLINNYR